MQFRAMLRLAACILLILQPLALAKASWKKVSVSGSYPGRGETAFSRCGGDKICLLGGRGANRVNILDTDSLTWRAGQSGSVQMHHFQGFQGPDKCVWVAGAWTGGYPNEATVNNIWRYCPDSNKWFKDALISRPRGSGGAVYHNGKVYLVTGNVGGHRKGAKVVPWFDSYDPRTGKWARLPDIPHARDHCHAVVRNNKLYVAGGRRSTSNAPEFFDDTVPEVDVYDFKTGKWNTISKLSRPRGGAAAAVHGNNVYLLGGEANNRAWTEVDVLEGATVKPGPSLPEPRHGTGVVSCGGTMWIAGGARVLGGGNNAEDTYAFFDGETPPVCSFQKNTDGKAVNKPMEDTEPVLSDDPGAFADTILSQNGLSLESTPESTAIGRPEEPPVEVPEHSPLSKTDESSLGVVSTPSTVSDAAPEPSPITEIEAADPNIVLEVPDPITDFMVSRSPDVLLAPTHAFVDLEAASAEPSMMSPGFSIETPPLMGLSEPSLISGPSPSLAATTAPIDASTMDQTGGSPFSTNLRERDPTPSPVIHSPDSSPVTIVVSEADSTQHFSTPPSSYSSRPNSSPVRTQPAMPPSSPSQDLSSSETSTSPIQDSARGIGNGVDENDETEGPSAPIEVSISGATGQGSSAGPSMSPGEAASGTSAASEVGTLEEKQPRPSDDPSMLFEEASFSPGVDEWELWEEASASSEWDDERSSCFPSDAMVELEDGSTKAMRLVRIGDRVKVAHPKEFSEVFFFSHKHKSKKSDFVRIESSLDGVGLTVSPGHLVYVNGKLERASAVRVGDSISVAHDARSATVTDVSRVRGVGLHNPHTLHGDIVVNGVVASTFTSSVHPGLAKVLLAPFRAAFVVFKGGERVEELNRVVLRSLDMWVWRE